MRRRSKVHKFDRKSACGRRSLDLKPDWPRLDDKSQRGKATTARMFLSAIAGIGGFTDPFPKNTADAVSHDEGRGWPESNPDPGSSTEPLVISREQSFPPNYQGIRREKEQDGGQCFHNIPGPCEIHRRLSDADPLSWRRHKNSDQM